MLKFFFHKSYQMYQKDFIQMNVLINLEFVNVNLVSYKKNDLHKLSCFLTNSLAYN